MKSNVLHYHYPWFPLKKIRRFSWLFYPYYIALLFLTNPFFIFERSNKPFFFLFFFFFWFNTRFHFIFHLFDFFDSTLIPITMIQILKKLSFTTTRSPTIPHRLLNPTTIPHRFLNPFRYFGVNNFTTVKWSKRKPPELIKDGKRRYVMTELETTLPSLRFTGKSLYPPVGKSVVVVESLDKARTIRSYLGGMYEVLSCNGLVMDLDPGQNSASLDNDFCLFWEISNSSQTRVKRISAALKGYVNYHFHLR